MTTLNDLKAWIERDGRLCRWRVRFIDDAKGGLHCQIMARRHIFTVTAQPEDDYLGCTCRTRFHLLGQGHYRFADLADGRLTAETWQAIFGDMKRIEIRPYRGRGL